MMNFVNLPDILEEDDDLDVLEFVVHGIPRQIYERKNYFDAFDEVAFRRRFRLSRASVLCLLEEIERELEYPHDMNNSVAPMNQLLACLRLYSTGGHLQQVADFMGMHVSTVCRIVKRVSEAIARLYGQYIRFPHGIGEIRATQQGFFSIAAFPRVIGAIDGTHIKIQSPGGNDAEIYRNRKQFFSINTQVICDSKLKITNVVARWAGSAHDSTIFNHSSINRDFLNNLYPNCILLGDSGYANGNFLLTQLLHPRTPVQQLYNESHIRTRNVVERCFGVLKRRFPILAYEAPPAPEEINEQDLEVQINDGQMPNIEEGPDPVRYELPMQNDYYN
ncbi:putative nuclease HARBI1 [Zophobas morio]|uniref:putative nuclease HARBI1 n=1 Tax=Zophobas morio TaxID=2755281 RepID=UPI0030838E21